MFINFHSPSMDYGTIQNPPSLSAGTEPPQYGEPMCREHGEQGAHCPLKVAVVRQRAPQPWQSPSGCGGVPLQTATQFRHPLAPHPASGSARLLSPRLPLFRDADNMGSLGWSSPLTEQAGCRRGPAFPQPIPALRGPGMMGGCCLPISDTPLRNDSGGCVGAAGHFCPN